MNASSPDRSTAAAAIVRQALADLSRSDIAGWLTALSEDAVIRMPFAPAGLPDRLEGKTAIAQSFAQVFEGKFDEFALSNIEVRAMADPSMVVATARSRATLKSGCVYENRYVWINTLRDGLIIESDEYFDPLRVMQAFGARNPFDR